jgi:dihydroorotate dehydrogenase (NAD+) catalytic subunit
MRPTLAGVTGGLSGPAIRPVAVRCIWQLHAAMPDVPIIGVGGIKTGLDALELVLAGASAVQVGTVIFHDPHAPVRVLGELGDALTARSLTRFTDAIGRAHRSPSAPDERHVGSIGSTQRAVDPRSVRNDGPFHRTGRKP